MRRILFTLFWCVLAGSLTYFDCLTIQYLWVRMAPVKRLVATGSGHLMLGGENYDGDWMLYNNGKVRVVRQSRESWTRLDSGVGVPARNPAPPTVRLDPQRATGGWILWKITRDRYRFEYLNGLPDTAR